MRSPQSRRSLQTFAGAAAGLEAFEDAGKMARIMAADFQAEPLSPPAEVGGSPGRNWIFAHSGRERQKQPCCSGSAGRHHCRMPRGIAAHVSDSKNVMSMVVSLRVDGRITSEP